MDITDLILSDHHEQRRMFAMLEEIDSSETEALGAIWNRLEILLEVHARAEEVLFYPLLAKLPKDEIEPETPDEETEDAIHDHNEIRDAIADVATASIGTTDWMRAVGKANEVNSDHMAEEERQGLTDFRRKVSLQSRHDIAVKFAAFEAEHAAGITPEDQDPQKYVEENK